MKYITAVYSGLVWGSGQFFNKQKLKGLILFVLQIAFISIELLTAGAWKNSGAAYGGISGTL